MASFTSRAKVILIILLINALALAGCAGGSADNASTGAEESAATVPVEGGNEQEATPSPSEGQSYASLNESEKQNFVREKAVAVLKGLGQFDEGSLPDSAVSEIRKYVDSYARRVRSERLDDCSNRGWTGSDLGSVIGRGSKTAPVIGNAFRDEGLAPTIGLYIAMIESEFCPCLQSPTGPLGIFQLTTAEGRRFGLDTKVGSTPADPDDRCEIEDASRAEAKRLKAAVAKIVGEFPAGGPGAGAGSPEAVSADGVLMAVAASNFGVDSFTKAVAALDLKNPPSIWSVTDNSAKMPQPFEAETRKYVPRFIAAAIIGENPSNFGIRDRTALSSLKKRLLSRRIPMAPNNVLNHFGFGDVQTWFRTKFSTDNLPGCIERALSCGKFNAR